MADPTDKREASIPYKVTSGTLPDVKDHFGSMTARVGLFKAIFKDGADLASGCADALVQTSVKGHERERIIGGTKKTIAATSYVATVYPRKNVSIGKGGEEYRILVDGSWWKFRVSGRQCDFHGFLCQSKENLKIDVYYKTQNGASYFVNRKEELQ
jgi:hypothetical protein|tara:strand:- start:99 stop:566 length:468 start_codon:yes stop_codon:yes gene_type:complete